MMSYIIKPPMKKWLQVTCLTTALSDMQSAQADSVSEKMIREEHMVIETLKSIKESCGIRVIAHEVRGRINSPVTEIAFSYTESSRACIMGLLDEPQAESCTFFNPQSRLAENSKDLQASFLIDCNQAKAKPDEAELICSNIADRVDQAT